MSLPPTTSVGSVAKSLAALGSPAAASCAVLVTPGNAAGDTATTSVNAALSPAAIAPAKLALTRLPLALTIQPLPEPDTNASPAGSVSATATGPGNVPPPMLVTTSV